jgi:hypothetical protein
MWRALALAMRITPESKKCVHYPGNRNRFGILTKVEFNRRATHRTFSVTLLTTVMIVVGNNRAGYLAPVS